MESWWIWAGGGVLAVVLLIIPIRMGLQICAGAEGMRAWALYNLGGPIKGSVVIPSVQTFKRPFRARRSPGSSTAGDDEEMVTSGKRRGLRANRRGLVVTGLKMALAIFRRVERFEWVTRVGTGDAAYTSWCTGMLWALKSGAVSFLSRHYTWLSAPKLNVVPDFDGASFRLDLTCIFRFTFGEIIVAAISYVLGQLRKGGL